MDQSRNLRVVAGGGSDETSATSDAPAVDSTSLLGGRREIRIQHGESVYRLRITASQKLILTK